MEMAGIECIMQGIGVERLGEVGVGWRGDGKGSEGRNTHWGARADSQENARRAAWHEDGLVLAKDRPVAGAK